MGGLKYNQVILYLTEYPVGRCQGTLERISLARLKKEHIVTIVGILTQRIDVEYHMDSDFNLSPHFKGLVPIHAGWILFVIFIFIVIYISYNYR